MRSREPCRNSTESWASPWHTRATERAPLGRGAARLDHDLSHQRDLRVGALFRLCEEGVVDQVDGLRVATTTQKQLHNRLDIPISVMAK
jgi:hypothetical protein